MPTNSKPKPVTFKTGSPPPRRFGNLPTGRPRLYQALADAIAADPDAWQQVNVPSDRASTMRNSLKKTYGVVTEMRTNPETPNTIWVRGARP